MQLQEVIINFVNNAIDAMAPLKVDRRALKVSTMFRLVANLEFQRIEGLGVSGVHEHSRLPPGVPT
jgi:hypothetical protein